MWDYEKVTKLATYNAEVSRGIVHTVEYRQEMAELQAAYDLMQREDDGLDVIRLFPDASPWETRGWPLWWQKRR